MDEVAVDATMAPLDDLDFSDDEKLDELEDVEKPDTKEELNSPVKDPASPSASVTHGHAQPVVLSASKEREDFLTARQLRIAMFALCDGLRQASRVFSTETQVIQSWLKEARRHMKQTDEEQKADATGTERMVAWVLSMREQQLPITESNLFHKASMLKKKGAFGDSFRISYDWAVSFLLLQRLGVRTVGRAPSLARVLPPSLEAKVASFRRFTRKVFQVHKLAETCVAAMDELCLFVDLRLAQDKFRSLEALEFTGSSPLVTVYLTVLADGTMLPSLVLTTRQLLAKVLPEFILLEASTDGLSVEETLDLWNNRVWQQHLSGLAQAKKSMLVLDRHREHLGDQFLGSVSGSRCLPAVIPAGCSFHLQPLEMCLKPALQRHLLSRWSEFTARNPSEMEDKAPQQLQAHVTELLVDWLVEALTHLNKVPQLWKQSFDLTGILPTNIDQSVEDKTSPKPEKIQSDLLKTLAEKVLGTEATATESPDWLELEDIDDSEEGQEEEEQDEKDEGMEVEEKHEETDRNDGKQSQEESWTETREKEGQDTGDDVVEVRKDGEKGRTEEPEMRQDREKEPGTVEDRREEPGFEKDGDTWTIEDRKEEMKTLEEDRSGGANTLEDRRGQPKTLEEDRRGGPKTLEEDRTGEQKTLEENGKRQPQTLEKDRTGGPGLLEEDRKEEPKTLEEDSEEEERGVKEDKKEVNKERRETRIVIGEEVGDEWKITVKSRNESVEAEEEEDVRMDER